MRRLTLFTLILAFVVIQLGAFTRLTDAGLGCPDWPGCYGFLTVPSAEQISTAEARFPERPVEQAKAWAEMIHRYVAGALGLFIVALAVMSLRAVELRRLSWLLVALVIFQGALGMWTVTQNLMPLIVMGHLLGGFTILSLLLLLWLRQQSDLTSLQLTPLKGLASLALVVLAIQIALGGWTAANYAALACTELPFCEGQWWTNLRPAEAFHPLPPPAQSYEFGVLDYPARMTIHIAHRLGALLTVTVLALLIWRCWCLGAVRPAMVTATLLALQVSLGVANVLGGLPLWVAQGHNAAGALLLLALVWINHLVWGRTRQETWEQTDVKSSINPI